MQSYTRLQHGLRWLSNVSPRPRTGNKMLWTWPSGEHRALGRRTRCLHLRSVVVPLTHYALLRLGLGQAGGPLIPHRHHLASGGTKASSFYHSAALGPAKAACRHVASLSRVVSRQSLRRSSSTAALAVLCCAALEQQSPLPFAAPRRKPPPAQGSRMTRRHTPSRRRRCSWCNTGLAGWLAGPARGAGR